MYLTAKVSTKIIFACCLVLLLHLKRDYKAELGNNMTKSNNIQKVPIAKGSGLMVYNPSIEYFIEKIAGRKYFSFVRFQVEFWCTARIALQFMGYRGWAYPNSIDITPEFIKTWSQNMIRAWEEKQSYKRPWVFKSEIFEEQLNMIVNPKPNNFKLAVSDRAWFFGKFPPPPGNWPWSPRMVKKMIPSGEIPFNAICWRRWGYFGEIQKFFNTFKDKRIVIVGPYYFDNFGEKLGLKNYTHIKISHTNASEYVYDYLEEIKKFHNSISPSDDVIYFFSGGSPGIWLIQQLHNKLHNAFMIDIGRAFDVYYFYDTIRKGDAAWKWGCWLERNPPKWIKNKLSNVIR